MKPEFESIEFQQRATFLVRQFEEEYFSSSYHFHPEIELAYIIKGQGKRFVGNRVEEYMANELVLLGENLPHCWKTTNAIPAAINAISLVLQFNRDFLGSNFFEQPEMASINQLLTASKNGLKFSTSTARETAPLLLKLKQENNAIRRIGMILDILDRLSRSSGFIFLESQNIYEHINLIEREKINVIQAFIVDNFKEEISIQDAASLINMSPFGFCKYFKKVTRRTFRETVINYRIEYAVNQLSKTDHSVTNIAFESGFNDLSNFYKTFKQKKQCSPLQYRKSFI